MIEPHLATMLVYVLTDLDLPKETLNKMLRVAVSKSFNAISVGALLW
jgi:glutamate N-acetyltransferase/amino-acid N-acetyltransferase